MLRQAAEFAQQHKVMLAIEYLNRFECYFLTTAADAKALVQAVNHPHFRTMYDTFHANIEEKAIGPAIEAIAGALRPRPHQRERPRHARHRPRPLGRDVPGAARRSSYDGWLVIEAFGRALPDLAAATKVWRDLFPERRGGVHAGAAVHQGEVEGVRVMVGNDHAAADRNTWAAGTGEKSGKFPDFSVPGQFETLLPDRNADQRPSTSLCGGPLGAAEPRRTPRSDGQGHDSRAWRSYSECAGCVCQRFWQLRQVVVWGNTYPPGKGSGPGEIARLGEIRPAPRDTLNSSSSTSEGHNSHGRLYSSTASPSAPGTSAPAPTRSARRSATEVAFAAKIREYKKLGFDGVQFHDDDVVPGRPRPGRQTQKGVAEGQEDARRRGPVLRVHRPAAVGAPQHHRRRLHLQQRRRAQVRHRPLEAGRRHRQRRSAARDIVLWLAREGTYIREAKDPIDAPSAASSTPSTPCSSTTRTSASSAR